MEWRVTLYCVSSHLPGRCILHADADRFYFAVEAIERPELALLDRPVIIGHDPRQAPRAVVTTANDPARALGIDSGLSCRVALGRAPNAVFVAPRMDIYREYSRRLMVALRSATDTLEQLSVDEAWINWDKHGFDLGSAIDLRGHIREVTGLSVSVGVAPSKLLAKMATESAKATQQGALVIAPAEVSAFLGPLPVESLWGVGPKTAGRLRSLGLVTIGAVADTALNQLQAAFGPRHGRVLAEHSRGIDHSELAPIRPPKSFSAERTFQSDVTDRAELWETMQHQARNLAERLERRGLSASEIAVKLRYADWEDLVRQASLPTPTTSAVILAQAAAVLMRRAWDKNRPLRLLGMRVSRFSAQGEPYQLEIPWA
ncbi:MAG: DNA polymerase IV [Chloroflexota bacterium]